MENRDLARFESAWNEAITEQQDRRWRRIRKLLRFLRLLRQPFASGGTLPERKKNKDEIVVQISPAQVMTRDGHILYIDPRCQHCREFFGE